MAMKVGYPNLSDRILGGPEPGGDIMIHGGCASIGCLAMSDERIQELWVMAEPVQTTSGIRIHILPTREPETLSARPDYEHHRDFWETLYRGDALFEQSGRVPEVNVQWNGRYLFAGET
jgi:murein L,D-transpeptidase YafK